MNPKEITIEIDGKKYHGFLYEVAKPSSQQYYMEHSIEELDLSVRTYNCLKRVGINNFYDVRQKDLSSIYKNTRNLGKKSLMELYLKVYKQWGFIIPCGIDKEISELADHHRQTRFAK